MYSGYQDPDSQWNSQFRTAASPNAALIVAASLAFQGPSVTLTYDNGEEKTEASFAILRAGANFTGVNTGEDFYNRFCNPETLDAAASTTSFAVSSSSTAASSATAAATPAPAIQGYPFPVVRDGGANTTHGYFLNGSNYENVAVLVVSAFSPAGDLGAIEYLTDFQDTIAAFLAQSKAAGKTRLVIDLATNGGGFVVAGYELFAQVRYHHVFLVDARFDVLTCR
jgi:hypothetical protein